MRAPPEEYISGGALMLRLREVLRLGSDLCAGCCTGDGDEPVRQLELADGRVVVAEHAVAAEHADDQVLGLPYAAPHLGLYDGPVDGRLGPITQAAYARFQASRGEVADGFITRKSFEELSAAD